MVVWAVSILSPLVTPNTLADEYDPPEAVAPTSYDDCLRADRDWQARVHELFEQKQTCNQQACGDSFAPGWYACLQSDPWKEVRQCGGYENTIHQSCVGAATQYLCTQERQRNALSRCAGRVKQNQDVQQQQEQAQQQAAQQQAAQQRAAQQQAEAVARQQQILAQRLQQSQAAAQVLQQQAAQQRQAYVAQQQAVQAQRQSQILARNQAIEQRNMAIANQLAANNRAQMQALSRPSPVEDGAGGEVDAASTYQPRGGLDTPGVSEGLQINLPHDAPSGGPDRAARVGSAGSARAEHNDMLARFEELSGDSLREDGASAPVEHLTDRSRATVNHAQAMTKEPRAEIDASPMLREADSLASAKGGAFLEQSFSDALGDGGAAVEMWHSAQSLTGTIREQQDYMNFLAGAKGGTNSLEQNIDGALDLTKRVNESWNSHELSKGVVSTLLRPMKDKYLGAAAQLDEALSQTSLESVPSPSSYQPIAYPSGARSLRVRVDSSATRAGEQPADVETVTYEVFWNADQPDHAQAPSMAPSGAGQSADDTVLPAAVTTTTSSPQHRSYDVR